MQRKSGPVPAATKAALTAALTQRDHTRALELATKLEQLDPSDPRWPHKCGDLFRSQGRPHEAAAAYRRAAKCYQDQGFTSRATAIRQLARELGGQSAGLTSVHHSILP